MPVLLSATTTAGARGGTRQKAKTSVEFAATQWTGAPNIQPEFIFER
jgi:hypothetical protein